MKKVLVGLLLALSITGYLSVPSLLARTQLPQATATPSPTPTPTPTPTLTPTPSPTPGLITLTRVEPATMSNATGGTLSLYGTGFNSDCVVRLVGYGLLPTTFINGQALTAQVPAQVPPATYDLEVNDGHPMPAVLLGAFTITTPPATPAPEEPAEPPPPGRPILTIRNYNVQPEQVRPGQEFVVSIELYNNGSRAGENTLVIFPGGMFLPLGEKGHNLWQLPINHTAVVTQRMRAPAQLSGGVHQLQVSMSANDWAGDHYDYSGSIPVEIIGSSGSGGGSAGKPKVIIETAVTSPRILIPGEPFSLTLRLVNLGRRTALNVFATCASSEMAIPASGGDTVATDLIRIGQAATVTLPLVLGSLDSGGRQNLMIGLEYADYSGGGYSDQQNVGVDINTSLAKEPQLLISEYTTEPEFLSPGDTFTLTIYLTNVGGGDAERLTLSLGGKDGANLEPFIPLKAGNVLFVAQIESGETVVLSRSLLIDGAAAIRAYNLPLALDYDDPHATRQSDIQRLSLIVRKRPEFQLGFYRQPEVLQVNVPAPLSLELINVGRSSINISEIAPSSPGLEVTVEGLPFVGPLDAGGSTPLDLLVIPQESGEVELLLSIAYRDDFNQTQSISQTLTLEVQGQPEAHAPGEPGMSEAENPAEEQPETIWQKIGRAIKGFLGLGS
ncbi:MAG: hypothetical protein U9Q70_13800 [Chloroflexota bacterium]|nr:hypothetical protein [Chloroflexota bacterium]